MLVTHESLPMPLVMIRLQVVHCNSQREYTLQHQSVLTIALVNKLLHQIFHSSLYMQHPKIQQKYQHFLDWINNLLLVSNIFREQHFCAQSRSCLPLGLFS